jgi:hypothetical protein
MKSITNVLILAVAMMVSSLVTAQSTKEIESKLRNIPFPVYEQVEAKAYVKFDTNNKIVAVRVKSENEQINNFIKTRLIRSTMKNEKFEADSTYVIPVKVLSKNR